MRKFLALFVACFYLMQAGGALAASYEACCLNECKAVQCSIGGCQTCASPAATPTEVGSLLLPAQQAVPAWTHPKVRDPQQEIWRPPD